MTVLAQVLAQPGTCLLRHCKSDGAIDLIIIVVVVGKLATALRWRTRTWGQLVGTDLLLEACLFLFTQVISRSSPVS